MGWDEAGNASDVLMVSQADIAGREGCELSMPELWKGDDMEVQSLQGAGEALRLSVLWVRGALGGVVLG